MLLHMAKEFIQLCNIYIQTIVCNTRTQKIFNLTVNVWTFDNKYVIIYTDKESAPGISRSAPGEKIDPGLSNITQTKEKINMKTNIKERAQAQTLMTLEAYLEGLGEFMKEIEIKKLLEYIDKKEKEYSEMLHNFYD